MSEVEKRVTAVLVAAGSSTRMGFDKLSFDLGGETVVQRSIRAFAECPLVDEIVLVAGKNREFLEQQAAACQKPVQVVPGGATRAESAKNGVLAASGEIVAVHDAARPFVSEAVIEAAVDRDDFAPFHRLVETLADPFTERDGLDAFARAPEPHERVLQTFCGT